MNRIVLEGDCQEIAEPGQFVNVLIQGCHLRRPISVCDVENNRLTLLYKLVGRGTNILASYLPGNSLNLITGLGNGYDTALNIEHPLLIGGGMGMSPLYWLCKKLLSEGKLPHVILGFGGTPDIVMEKEYLDLGVPVTIATMDGSKGVKGTVVDAMEDISYDYFFTCGPMPMYRAMNKVMKTSGQYSFEAHMGCGIGACYSCSCKTMLGTKQICKDGPVFKKEEILWEN